MPRKTVFQLCSLLTETSEKLTMQTSENKIKFSIGNIKLISKVIDGKFPDYQKVIPKDNDKSLLVPLNDFISSVERVVSVSIDRKEGVNYVGRTEFDSPDVDNEVLVDATQYYLKIGEFVKLKIVSATEFDLYAVPIENKINKI